MSSYKLYEVGGHVRDSLLGIKSKDVDYSFVWEDHYDSVFEALEEMVKVLDEDGFEIFLVVPEMYTVRAKFPESHEHSGVADFVMARKELYYPSGTRRPVVALGGIEDDLVRRDFTVNALAKGEDGEIIDLFGGTEDLHYRSLDTPTDPLKSFKDDPLRIIRALRFCVTKGFTLCRDVRNAIKEVGISGLSVVSQERIREELHKAFKHDTKKTLDYLYYFKHTLNYNLIDYCFSQDIWLEPTNKK